MPAHLATLSSSKAYAEGKLPPVGKDSFSEWMKLYLSCRASSPKAVSHLRVTPYIELLTELPQHELFRNNTSH